MIICAFYTQKKIQNCITSIYAFLCFLMYIVHELKKFSVEGSFAKFLKYQNKLPFHLEIQF